MLFVEAIVVVDIETWECLQWQKSPVQSKLQVGCSWSEVSLLKSDNILKYCFIITRETVVCTHHTIPLPTLTHTHTHTTHTQRLPQFNPVSCNIKLWNADRDRTAALTASISTTLDIITTDHHHWQPHITFSLQPAFLFESEHSFPEKKRKKTGGQFDSVITDEGRDSLSGQGTFIISS